MRWARWYTHSIPLTGDERNWDRCRGTGGDYYLHSIPLTGDVRNWGQPGSRDIFLALGTGHFVSSDNFFLVMDGDGNLGHFLALDALEADPVFLAIDRTEQLWFGQWGLGNNF